LVFWPIETLYRINMRLRRSTFSADIITRDTFGEGNAGLLLRVVDDQSGAAQVQNDTMRLSAVARKHDTQRRRTVRT